MTPLSEKISRNLSVLYAVLRREGLLPCLECIARQIGALVFGMSDLGHPRSNLLFYRATDILFDAFQRVDTGGLIYLPEMEGIGREYVATPPRAWKLLIGYLPIEPSRFTYIDLGCGKGRTLLLAAQKGFGRVIGVDIPRCLLDTARRNMTLVGMVGELICGDVRTVEFPCGPLVVFMYNPFSEDVMRRVARNLGESLSCNPRKAYVLYYSAAYTDAWEMPGFEILRSSNATYPNYVIYQYRVVGEIDALIPRTSEPGRKSMAAPRQCKEAGGGK